MGFFAKLFRRKGGDLESKTSSRPTKSKGGRRNKNLRDSPTELANEDVPPPPQASLQVQRDFVSPAPRKVHGPDLSVGSSRVILSPRNGAGSVSNSKDMYKGGPVDLDQSDIEYPETDENHMRLSAQRLQQFTELQQGGKAKTTVFAMEEPAQTRFSAGNILMDDSRSENSSSLNFSTDAEDQDYEKLKKSGVLPSHPVPPPAPTNLSLDMSNISSPTYYATDGETTVFPNLQTDDEATTTERESSSNGGAPHSVDTGRQLLSLSQKKGKNELDSMAWAQIEKDSRTGSVGSKSNSYSASQTTASSHDRGMSSFTTSGLSHASNPSAAPRRNFTSPKTRNTEMVHTDFANFADFAHFEGNSSSKAAGKSPPRIFIEADRSSTSHRRSSSGQLLVTSGAADTNVLELLERAKSKSSSGRARRAGSSSINSAPALSASYLRQHHGLKSRHEARHERHNSESRSSYQDGTSVTDIIESLETANASRHRSANSSGSRSVGRHDDGSASVRSAKERLRRRRERERRSSGSPQNHSSESEEDHEENWLMDEVTGALGPRGIAADLESLSGRSNRSKSSGGGLSHKSHRSHRSHKSHRSSRRKKTSSGESVDSHGSRRSRSSRYSHRSTRSYLSQMSEQSRSVANDLLRLEMQLAMVGGGSSDHPEGSQSAHVRSSGSVGGGGARSSSSVGGAPSRSSRSGSRPSGSSVSRGTRSAARRNRITVVAPPGKLGIILANKADSKGTVVSGVRTSSVLVDRISPGDRIVAIDGEDVSLMTVSEITTIMARKSEFERTLSVLTTPKTAPVDPLVTSSSPRAVETYRYRN